MIIKTAQHPDFSGAALFFVEQGTVPCFTLGGDGWFLVSPWRVEQGLVPLIPAARAVFCSFGGQSVGTRNRPPVPPCSIRNKEPSPCSITV